MVKRWYYIAVLLVLFSCKKDKDGACLVGTGDIQSQVRELDPFEGVQMLGYINYELIDTTINKVEITIGENLMQGISTEVTNGKLIIKDNNRCHWARNYNKEKTIKIYGSPKYIWQHAEGTFECTNYKKDTLFFYLEGENSTINLNNAKRANIQLYQTGSLTLTGKCEAISTDLTAYGSFYAYDCDINNMALNHSGEGNAYISATDTMGVNILSVGNVYYKTTPSKILLTDKGDGELVRE